MPLCPIILHICRLPMNFITVRCKLAASINTIEISWWFKKSLLSLPGKFHDFIRVDRKFSCMNNELETYDRWDQKIRLWNDYLQTEFDFYKQSNFFPYWTWKLINETGYKEKQYLSFDINLNFFLKSQNVWISHSKLTILAFSTFSYLKQAVVDKLKSNSEYFSPIQH